MEAPESAGTDSFPDPFDREKRPPLPVLLVEDNASERWLYTEILRTRGHQVTSCADAERGWEAFRAGRYPLVLLDLGLPGPGDGLDLCRRIREEESAPRTVVLVITGRSDPDTLEAVMDVGADDYITKPIDAKLLNIRLAVAERELRSRREKERTRVELDRATLELRRLFENLDDVFFSVDAAAGRVIQVSPSIRNLLGISPEALLEGSVDWRSTLFPGEVLDRVESLASEAPEETLVHGFDHLGPDGSSKRIEARYRTRPGVGGPGRIDGTFTDVTERIEADRALRKRERRARSLARALKEANAELEAFAYTVSHDLRAPLRTMQGFAHTLLQAHAEELSPQALDYMNRIVASGERAEELISDLLEYSRLSFEAIELRPVDLGEVVDEVRERLAADLAATEAELRVDTPLPTVMGQSPLLVQAVQNLVSNALKFVPEGRTPRVVVRGSAEDGTARLDVADNGIGIPEEKAERIFRVFERLTDAGDRAGTGIGLAIVRRAMERLGGKVGVDSTPGEGSVFWLELPTRRR